MYGKWYARVVTMGKTVTLEELAEHMAQHNTPYSEGVIRGVLTDMVNCIRELVLEGKSVKIPNLAIFSAGIKSTGPTIPTTSRPRPVCRASISGHEPPEGSPGRRSPSGPTCASCPSTRYRRAKSRMTKTRKHPGGGKRPAPLPSPPADHQGFSRPIEPPDVLKRSAKFHHNAWGSRFCVTEIMPCLHAIVFGACIYLEEVTMMLCLLAATCYKHSEARTIRALVLGKTSVAEDTGNGSPGPTMCPHMGRILGCLLSASAIFLKYSTSAFINSDLSNNFFQIINFLTCLLCISNLASGALADIAADIDNIDFIGHVDFAEVHVIKHFLCARFPYLFIAGMPEQTYADDNTPLQGQSFLSFHELLLETGTATECDNLIVLYHLYFVKVFLSLNPAFFSSL